MNKERTPAFRKLSRRKLIKMGIAGAVGQTLLGATPVCLGAPKKSEAWITKSKASGPVTTVGNCGHKPTFTVDKQPFTVPVFETYDPKQHFFQQFADAGTKVFNFSVSFGGYAFTPPMSTGPKQWNFSEMDARARRVLAAAPGGLIMPRIYLGAPDWWLDEYPDELLVLDNGARTFPSSVASPVPKNHRFPSLASEKWREQSAEGLQRLIDHIQRSDYGAHIFGYMITGLMTEEWYHWSSSLDLLTDYNPLMARAFQNWLRRKYDNVAALRAAWNDPTADFERVAIPSKAERMAGSKVKTFRDPGGEMPVIDFCLFNNEIIPAAIDYYCHAAKEASGGKKVVGAFYGYMFEFGGDPEFGHNALGKLMQSPSLDFMMVTASYGSRELGAGADYARSPITSVALHKKLWYHDNDAVSYLFYEMKRKRGWKEGYGEGTIGNTGKSLGATDNARESIWQYRRGAGFTLGAGVFEALFDLHGGYFEDPDLMAEVKRLNAVFDESRSYDRSSCAEILVVSDETSCSYAVFHSPLLAQTMQPPQPILTKIGAPHDSILVDDLALLDTSGYKLIIFLNTCHLTDAQRDLVRRKALSAGKTVLWCYAPGFFNQNRTSTEAMEALTGLRIVPAEDQSRIAPRIALRETDHPLSKEFNAAGLSVIGPEGQSCQLLSVQDAAALTLGTLPGSQAATLALKQVDRWTSIYAITPDLPAAFYQALARAAGVHIYNDKPGDTLYVSKSYLTLAANEAGPRTIKFPARCDVFDPFANQRLYKDVTEFSREFQAQETLLVRWSRNA